MLRKPAVVLCILTCLCSALAHASPDATLRQYIHSSFPALELHPLQITQLTWVMQHSRQSNDMDSKIAANNIHIEISRALTRLYCMQLLKRGTQDAYQEFIAAQLHANSKVLSFDSFKILSKYLQNLCDADYELLQDATILLAISMSDRAEQLAQRLLQHNEMHDSLGFLATTLRVDPNIYPLAHRYSNDRAAAKKLLYVLFPPQTNFRHMLYTEGGISMFNYLRVMIQHQYVNQDDVDLWYAYWIVNIAGFRGHVSHHGSLYLTEPLFQAMQELKDQIDLMLYTPNYNPLIPYLEYRAKLLGLQHLPQDQQLLLAHIGALLQMYDAKDGALLEDTFTALPLKQQTVIAAFFRKGIEFNDRHVTTHFPALFANTLQLVKGDKRNAIKIAVPLYSQAVVLYTNKMRAGKLHPELPLCFNYMSATKNLRRYMTSRHGLEQLAINASGELVFKS